MRAKDGAEIGIQQIDAILRFLPIFEDPGYAFGEWTEQEAGRPSFSFNPQTREFIRALEEQNILVRFDWMAWRNVAKRYEDPKVLRTADLATVRRLLTLHVRADRFVQGHLATVLESGQIKTFLRRLKEIRDERVSGD